MEISTWRKFSMKLKLGKTLVCPYTNTQILTNFQNYQSCSIVEDKFYNLLTIICLVYDCIANK